MNDIPDIRFFVNGAEVMRMPAHLFLAIQAFRGGNIILPKPKTHISMQIQDRKETRVWTFLMPEIKEF